MAVNKSKIRWAILLIVVIFFVATIDWLSNRYHYHQSLPCKHYPSNNLEQ
jgi:hypothetical protein